MEPYFNHLLKYLDDTDWMYPTPQTFRTYQHAQNSVDNSSSTRQAPHDLPIFEDHMVHQPQMLETTDLARQMHNMRVQGHSASTLLPEPTTAAPTTEALAPLRKQTPMDGLASLSDAPGRAEAELEVSFADDSFQSTHLAAARNSRLVREVSLLGV